MVIFGSGEEAELAYLAIRALGMKLHGIVDPDRAGKTCLGYEIQNIAWLGEQNGMEILLVLQSARLESTFDEFKTNIQNKYESTPILCIEI